MKYRPFSGTRVVVALMLREMATTYGRSPGGYAWTIIEPIAGTALMTVIFMAFTRNPPLGSNFMLFYASGFMPFTTYTALSTRVGSAIRYSRPLLSYPSVTFIDTILSRFILCLLTNLLITTLMMVGLHIAFSIDASPDFARLANAVAMLSVLGMGVGLVNAYLSGIFPVWDQFWSILNRPLFLISGLFFLLDSMPEQIRSLLLWNPLAHIISEFRAGIYPIYEGGYVDSLYVYSIGLSLTFLGLLMLYKENRYLINEGA